MTEFFILFGHCMMSNPNFKAWSVLGPLLFIIYINDLQFVSDVLDPIMFADGTNFFYSQKDIDALFLKVNNEFIKLINGLFLISSHSI